MYVHPLQGRVRWLLYPLIATGAGGVAGLPMDALQRWDWGATSLLSMFGASAALGVSVSSRPWLGVAVAAAAGTAAFQMPRLAWFTIGWTWREILVEMALDVVRRPWGVGIAYLFSGHVAMVAWLRLRKGPLWSCFHLAGPLILGSAVWLAEGTAAWTGLLGIAAYFVGQWLAFEAALRLSKPPGEC